MKERSWLSSVAKSAFQAIERSQAIAETVTASALAYYGINILSHLLGDSVSALSLRAVLLTAMLLTILLFVLVFGVYFFRRQRQAGNTVANLKTSLVHMYLVELRNSQLNPDRQLTSQNG